MASSPPQESTASVTKSGRSMPAARQIMARPSMSRRFDEIGDRLRLEIGDLGEAVEEVRLLGFAIERDEQAGVEFAAVLL
jgi:hypothetical protein